MDGKRAGRMAVRRAVEKAVLKVEKTVGGWAELWDVKKAGMWAERMAF